MLIAIVLRRLILTLLVAFAGMCWLDQLMNPSPLPLLIDVGLVRRSDYPLCITVAPPPLLRAPAHKYEYRVNPGAFNGKGTA